MNCQQPGAIVLLISLLKILSAGADGDQLVSADQMERILDESVSDTAVEQSGVGGNYGADELESTRRLSYDTPRCYLSIIPL